MNGERVGIEVLLGVVRTAPKLVELVFGESPEKVEERLMRARAAVRDPIDTSASDQERWARLERALGTSS